VVFTKALRNSLGRLVSVEGDTTHAKKWQLLATPVGLPEGNEVADVLAPLGHEVVIAKPMPSAFFGTPLESYLTAARIDTVIVVGMVTSGCVRCTVVDAYMRNYRVVVVQDAVADYSSFQHWSSLLDMHVKYADAVPAELVVDHLLEQREITAAPRLAAAAP
jgi:nicotinamidase-related amidase